MTQAPDEQTILRYLHGELAEPETENLEERLFVDDDFHEKIQAVETDLIDRYVRNAMPDDARNRFDQNYLVTPERRSRVGESKSFHTALETMRAKQASRDMQPAVSWFEKLFASFSFSMPAMQFATASLILIMAAGMAWLVYDRSKTQREFAHAQDRLQDVQELTRKEQELHNRLAEQSRGESEALSALELEIAELRRRLDETRRRPDDAPAQAPVMATIFLPTTRGPVTVPSNVEVARSAKVLNIQVPVGETDAGPFEIVISKGGASVVALSDLMPRRVQGNNVVSVSVPTRKLTEGKHDVSIRDRNGDATTRAFVLIFR